MIRATATSGRFNRLISKELRLVILILLCGSVLFFSFEYSNGRVAPLVISA